MTEQENLTPEEFEQKLAKSTQKLSDFLSNNMDDILARGIILNVKVAGVRGKLSKDGFKPDPEEGK